MIQFMTSSFCILVPCVHETKSLVARTMRTCIVLSLGFLATEILCLVAFKKDFPAHPSISVVRVLTNNATKPRDYNLCRPVQRRVMFLFTHVNIIRRRILKKAYCLVRPKIWDSVSSLVPGNGMKSVENEKVFD